jgi:predicted transposase YbfD/YdcC
VHRLAALTHQTGHVMAPVDVDGTTNEMPPVKDLFDPWDISGQVVTWDALHTQTETARYRVADQRAPSVREIQGNHPSLRDTVKTLDPEDFSPAHTTRDRGHGRVEIQTIRTSTAFNDYLDWPFLGQVFRIDRPVTDGDGTHPCDEVALGLTDLTPAHADPARLSAYVRHHWGIESRLHAVRDMTDDEDRSQVRSANGPRVMATLRNPAIR